LSEKPKLLLNENIGLKIYHEILNRGYDVKSIMIEMRGASDEEVLRLAKRENRIIITMDKDFGYSTTAYNPPGILLLRLRNPNISNRLNTILRVLEEYKNGLYGFITMASEFITRRRPLTIEKT